MDSPSHTIDESIIQEMATFLPDNVTQERREKFLQECRTTFSSVESYGKEHVVGAPIIEIHHVAIDASSDSIALEQPLEIYGFVKVTNGQGETLYLFNQPEDDPNTLSFGEVLYLLDVEPILAPFPVTKMDIHLMDKANGIELAKGTLVWDYTEKKISLEEQGEESLQCENSTVHVAYTTFEAAVVAHVDLKLCKKNEFADDCGSGCHDIDVVGDVFASYESNYSFTKDFSASLASVGKDEPLKVKSGTYIPLYKSIVAVPVYSSLKLQVSLLNLVDGYTIHRAQHGGFDRQQIEGPNGYPVDVYIKWTPGNPVKEMEQMQTCSELVVNDDSPLAFWIYRQSTKSICSLTSSIEVFSIVILPDELDEKTHQDGFWHLYGEIAFNSLPDEFYLFKRDESFLESFPCGKGQKLIIEGPHEDCFTSGRPGVRIKLNDVRGCAFCKGYIAWDEVLLRNNYDISWYDRRLCSIIHGEYGLVKVHYSIFRNAVRATVMVLFSFDNPFTDPFVDVNGSIFASCGNYGCTAYDKEYYRSLLFLKSQESPLEHYDRRKTPLPLLKSVIPVSTYSPLIIEVDLFVSTRLKPATQALKGVAKFELGVESFWRVRSDNFFIDVLVDWGSFYLCGTRLTSYCLVMQGVSPLYSCSVSPKYVVIKLTTDGAF